MESIRVPEHAFTEPELVRLSWRLQVRQIIILSILTFSYIGFALMALGLSGYVFLGVLVVACPITVVMYRLDTLPKNYRNPMARNSFRKRSFEFSEKGVFVQGEEGAYGLTPWSYFLHGRVWDDYYLLYFAPDQYYVVPRGLLPRPVDENLLRLITSKITPVKMG